MSRKNAISQHAVFCIPSPVTILSKPRVFQYKMADNIVSQQCTFFKDVHRRQKLKTDFFKLFEMTVLVVTISISREKNILAIVSEGSTN